MRVTITGDLNSESGISKVVLEISGCTSKHFRPKVYGDGLVGICIVLMCRSAYLKFKRRIRMSKKEKKLYMDIMLDITQMIPLTHEMRRQIVIERISREVPEVLSKYDLADFDRGRFIDDFTKWIQNPVNFQD